MPKHLRTGLVVTVFLAIGIGVGFILKKPKGIKGDNDYIRQLQKFEEVVRYVNENYFEEVDNNKMIEDAINGMLEGLDPHTFYISKKEMEAVNEQMTGSFEGVGIEFNIIDDTIIVVAPISGGPSYKLGIMPGDKIVEINGEVVAGVGFTNNDVVKSLRGPKGTVVKVGIKRQGVKELIHYEITRDKIPVYSVDVSFMIDDETGYIKVSRFAEKTFSEFVTALNSLKAKGMKNLVLDLRGNPGGYLVQAEEMADAFLTKDRLIVYTEGRIPESNSRYNATAGINQFEQGGLVILIDQGSASASEIVSGAVQDWDRGLIVGTRSFGKGLVQTQKQLIDGSAVRIVISRYFTPSGRCIQKPFDKKSNKEYEEEIYDRFTTGEIYDESKIEFPDSLKFKTAAGRTVYGGGGIMPDVYVAPDTTGTSKYLTNLLIKGVFNKFAFKYVEQHADIKTKYKSGNEMAEKFAVTNADLEDFKTYAAQNGVEYIAADFATSLKYIRNNIEAHIARVVFNDEGYFPVILRFDETFQQGLSLMPKAVTLSKTGKFEK